MNRGWLIVLPLVVVMTIGCAAFIADRSTPIAMASHPEGAEVWIDGNKMGVTPVTIELPNKRSYLVTFKSDGQEATARINSGIGAGWAALDVFVGLVPTILDAVTGSRYVVPDVLSAVLPVTVDATTRSWHGLHPHVLNLTLAPAKGN